VWIIIIKKGIDETGFVILCERGSVEILVRCIAQPCDTSSSPICTHRNSPLAKYLLQTPTCLTATTTIYLSNFFSNTHDCTRFWKGSPCTMCTQFLFLNQNLCSTSMCPPNFGHFQYKLCLYVSMHFIYLICKDLCF